MAVCVRSAHLRARQVRVERSAGAVVLESGEALQLIAHERHLLRRSDAEPLIRKGLVEHCMPGR